MNAFDKYHDLAARLLGKEEFPLPLPKMDRDYPHNIGLLSDAEESELTAKVLNHTKGMTLDVWKKLELEQRVPWLQIAVDNLGLAGDIGQKVALQIRASLRDRAATHHLLVNADEVATWPEGLLAHLMREGILSLNDNAKSITCDACGQDHVEQVQYVQSPPGTELRAYILCPENGRVRIPLTRLRQWTIAPAELPLETTRAEPTVLPATVVTTDEPLSERAQLVLVAMSEMGLIDSDHRRSTEDIAAKALGSSSDANSLKNVMLELKALQMIDSKTGRGGGCWLTDKGRIRAEKLRRV